MLKDFGSENNANIQQASMQLMNLLQSVSNPVSYLTTILIKAQDIQETVTCCLQLQNFIEKEGYSDFQRQCQVIDVSTCTVQHIGVKAIMEKLLKICLSLSSSDETVPQMKIYKDFIIKTLVRLSLQYWSENSCFQSYIQQIRSEFCSIQDQSSPTRTILLQIFQRMLESIKLITVFEDQGASSEVDDQNSSETQNLNYITVSLFIQTALPDIFTVLSEAFKQNCNYQKILEDPTYQMNFSLMAETLSYSLMLTTRPIKKSVNQISITLQSSIQNQGAYQNFCTPENIRDMIQLASQESLKKKARDQLLNLVSNMIRCQKFNNSDQVSITQGTILIIESSLLLLNNSVINPSKKIKILKVINLTIPFNILESSIAQKWLVHLTQITQVNNYRLRNYIELCQAWEPLIKVLERVDTQETSDISNFLFIQFQAAFKSVLTKLSKKQNAPDEDGDDEDYLIGFNKTDQQIKPLIQPLFRINLCRPSKMFEFILSALNELKSLAQLSESGIKNSETQVDIGCVENAFNMISWTYHSIKTLYSILITQIEQPCYPQLQIERAETCIKIAAFMIKEFNQFDSSNFEPIFSDPSISQQLVLSTKLKLKLSIQLCLQAIAKSLFTKKLKLGIQAEFQNKLATTLEIQNENYLLEFIITSALKQLYSKIYPTKDQSVNQLNDEISQSNLKILKYLTDVKPQAMFETITLQVRNFHIDQQFLMKLVEYLKVFICGEGDQQQILSNLSFQQQRQTIKSLMILMCESDYLSKDSEVMKIILQTLYDLQLRINQAKSMIDHSNFKIVCQMQLRFYNSVRAIFSGLYRESQYKFMMTYFIEKCNQFIMNDVMNISIWQSNSEALLKICKAILSMIQEICMDLDNRSQNGGHYNNHNVNLLTFSYEGTTHLIRNFVSISQNNESLMKSVMDLLQKALYIYIQLESPKLMTSTQLEAQLLLKQKIITLANDLLKSLEQNLDPRFIHQSSEATQKLVYSFLESLFQRNIHALRSISKEDAKLQFFMVRLIREGSMSSLNIVFQYSQQCIEQIFSKCQMKQSQLNDWIYNLFVSQAEEFKQIVKQTFLLILRGQKTYLRMRVESALKLIKIYESIDAQFLPQCIQEVALEFGVTSEEQLKIQTYLSTVMAVPESNKRLCQKAEKIVQQVLQNSLQSV
eukprot:403332705